MGTLFTILVVALAFFSIVIMMVIVLREKVDHEAHLKYVRSPWNDEDAPQLPPAHAHDAAAPAAEVDAETPAPAETADTVAVVEADDSEETKA